MRISDWSSDVCSSDLFLQEVQACADAFAGEMHGRRISARRGGNVQRMPTFAAGAHLRATGFAGKAVAPGCAPTGESWSFGELLLHQCRHLEIGRAHV